MRGVAAAVLLLVLPALTSCNGDREGLVTVPDLYGEENRSAQTTLARLDLRWTYEGSTRVWSEPPAPHIWSTAHDDLVVAQRPRPGTQLLAGEIVELETSCTLEPLPEGHVCID